ncbi:MAG TPA: hypothetical protein VGK89_07835 [Candidatus Eisenbacteria bacterium]
MISSRLRALARADRADLLLIALPNSALREACQRLDLTFPGYRLEKVKPIVMADSLASVYEESEPDAAEIDKIMETWCPLPPVIAEDMIPPTRFSNRLVELVARAAAWGPDAVVPLLWRLLGHPVESVRAAAAAAVKGHLDMYDEIMGGGPEGDGQRVPAPRSSKRAATAASLERQIEQSETRAGKLSADLEAVRKQLADERAQGARKDARLSELKRDLERAQDDLRTTREAKAALEAERDRDTRALLRRRESQAEDLKRAVATLEHEIEAAHKREADLLARLKSREAAPAPAPAAEAEAPAPSAEPAAPYQVPEFTREFYESIRGWDDRVLKTAFEKVLLLAGNFAHPSLDAKAIQGAEGLYRIKIGSDVRLLYRRGPNRGIEVLSLIDRENLNRYIRRYRKHAGP